MLLSLSPSSATTCLCDEQTGWRSDTLNRLCLIRGLDRCSALRSTYDPSVSGSLSVLGSCGGSRVLLRGPYTPQDWSLTGQGGELNSRSSLWHRGARLRQNLHGWTLISPEKTLIVRLLGWAICSGTDGNRKAFYSSWLESDKNESRNAACEFWALNFAKKKKNLKKLKLSS